MQELEKLRGVLRDLNKNQFSFSAHLKEFEGLQTQISALEKRACMDPEAARKLRSFNDYMGREGLQAQSQIMTHIEAFQRNAVSAHEQLAALSPAEPEGPAPVSQKRPASTRNRNFV